MFGGRPPRPNKGDAYKDMLIKMSGLLLFFGIIRLAPLLLDSSSSGASAVTSSSQMQHQAL
jgi:hypothetical protein